MKIFGAPHLILDLNFILFEIIWDSILQVICTKETLDAADRCRKEGRPAWRVSSTVFSQIASDEIIRPLGKFATPEAEEAYPPIASGEYVQKELEVINLRAPSPA